MTPRQKDGALNRNLNARAGCQRDAPEVPTDVEKRPEAVDVLGDGQGRFIGRWAAAAHGLAAQQRIDGHDMDWIRVISKCAVEFGDGRAVTAAKRTIAVVGDEAEMRFRIYTGVRIQIVQTPDQISENMLERIIVIFTLFVIRYITFVPFHLY